MNAPGCRCPTCQNIRHHVRKTDLRATIHTKYMTICRKQLLTKVRSFLLWSAYAATLGRFAAPLDETAVSPNQAIF